MSLRPCRAIGDCYRPIRFRERDGCKASQPSPLRFVPTGAPHPQKRISPLQRGPTWAATTTEETMFKITSDDLAKKTDSQLAALFQEVAKGITPTSPDRPAVQSLLALIIAERAKRGIGP